MCGYGAAHAALADMGLTAVGYLPQACVTRTG